MKKIFYLIVFFILAGGSLFAQNRGFKYKSVVSENGTVLTNHAVKLNVEFYENGSLVYSEHHETTTDANGIFRVTLGEGTATQGQFSDLDWSQSLVAIS